MWERTGPIVVPYGEDEFSVPTAEEMTAAIEDVEPRYTSTSGREVMPVHYEAEPVPDSEAGEFYTMGIAPTTTPSVS